VTTYISAESVITGLEELFPQEVRDHKMIAHALPLKDTAAIYRKALPNCLEATLGTTVRIECILLPLFGAEGLHPDRSFSISYRSKGDDLARYADRFGCDKYEADSLQKGNCFDNGPFYSRHRNENIIKTLKGKTVVFEPAPDNDNNDDEQSCGCSEGGEHNG